MPKILLGRAAGKNRFGRQGLCGEDRSLTHVSLSLSYPRSLVAP